MIPGVVAEATRCPQGNCPPITVSSLRNIVLLFIPDPRTSCSARTWWCGGTVTAAGRLSMIAALTGLPHSRRDGWKRTAASCESRLSVLVIPRGKCIYSSPSSRRLQRKGLFSSWSSLTPVQSKLHARLAEPPWCMRVCTARLILYPTGYVNADHAYRCTYHAWRFDSDGKCLSIPQSDKGGKDENNPKACAKVYPTQVWYICVFLG